MKISAFTAMMTDLSAEEAVKRIKAFGYDGVEWGIDHDYAVTFEKAVKDAEYYRRITEDEGLEIPAIGVGLRTSELERIKQIFDVCARMGVAQFRAWPPWYGFKWSEMKENDYHQLYEQAKRELEPIAKLAEEYGIKMTIEIHFGNVCPSVGLTYRLVKDFAPECIGVLYDPANMIVEGREAWKLGIELLGDYLVHVHVKNVFWRYGDRNFLEKEAPPGWHWAWADIDKGMVDWREIVEILKMSGYEGYLSLEDFSARPIDERLKAIHYLRQLDEQSFQ